MRELRHKTAFVTGAASGIGRAIALRLAKEGVHLFLVDFDEAGLARVVADARNEQIEVATHCCDLSRPEQVNQATLDLIDRWGGVDILVNNAGITYYGRTADMSAENWDRLMAINLLAPIHITRELLPSMLERDEAHVLNVASVCGLVGLGRVAAYCTSKFGLVGFSESLRAEYARRGLGVTALCPGFVDTNLFSSAAVGPDRKDNKIPPRRMLAGPDWIADRAVRAIRRNQAVVVLQTYARALHLTKRFIPGVMDMVNRFSRSRRKAAVTNVASPQSPSHRRAA